jgi:hypothetical protein
VGGHRGIEREKGCRRLSEKDDDGKIDLPLHPSSSHRLRDWYSADRMRGLVFTCREGELDLAHPAALLAAIVSWDPPPGIATLPCPDTDVAVIIGHTVNTLSAESLDHAEADVLRDAAVATWCEAGHPGWAVLSADGRAMDGPDAVNRLVEYVWARRVGGVNVLEVQDTRQ